MFWFMQGYTGPFLHNPITSLIDPPFHRFITVLLPGPTLLSCKGRVGGAFHAPCGNRRVRRP